MSHSKGFLRGTCPKLFCFICIMARGGVANKAITIVNGSAVCMDHIGYLSANRQISDLITTVKEAEGRGRG